MSDRTVVEALTRAALEPGGLPLKSRAGRPGLFASTPSAKRLAEQCRAEGWLETAGDDGPARVTPKGLGHLKAAADPATLLEDFTRALEQRAAQFDRLVAEAEHARASLARMDELLRAVTPGRDLAGAVLAALTGGPPSQGDCPLPELFGRLPEPPSVGRFHDALRGLHARNLIYLHPWTGPLYTLPQPPFALMVGHEVAYYASPRRG